MQVKGRRGQWNKMGRLLRVLRRLRKREEEEEHQSLTLHSVRDGSGHWEVSESEMEDSDTDYAPEDVPAGCLAVYVGEEEQRFVIRAKYLNHKLFKALLDKSKEEFGFQQKGGLHIPCEVVIFEHLLWLLSKKDPAATHSFGICDLLNFYSGSDGDMSS